MFNGGSWKAGEAARLKKQNRRTMKGDSRVKKRLLKVSFLGYLIITGFTFIILWCILFMSSLVYILLLVY